MTKSKMVDVLELISNNTNMTVRIYFKSDRSPIYGKLVSLDDSKDLLEKGFVRFVDGSLFDDFDNCPEMFNVTFTKLFKYDTFLDLKWF